MSNALQKDDNLLTGVSKQMSTCDIVHAKQQYFFLCCYGWYISTTKGINRVKLKFLQNWFILQL